MTAKELREKRAKLAAAILAMVKAREEGEEFSAEEQEKWEKINQEHDDLTRDIEIAQRAEEVQAMQEASAELRAVPRAQSAEASPPAAPEAPTEEDRALALQAWARSRLAGELSEAEREASARCGINPYAHDFEFNLRADPNVARRELRALSSIDGSTGGYTVPEGFMNQLEVAMLLYGGVRQVAEIIRTNSGIDLPWPTADDTSNTGEQVGESGDVTTEANPTFAQTILKAHKFSSKLVKVSSELIQDSAFDIVGFLAKALGERLGRILNTKFTTGTGAATPYGIVNRAATGVTSSVAGSIKYDDLVGLEHAVGRAYRVGASWMLSDNALLSIRKLKDGNGLPIWQPDMTGSAPSRILGYPYTINDDMADVATGVVSVLFGQMRAYKVREVRGITFHRLVELYRGNDQDGFVAFLRADGDLVDAGQNPVKKLTQA